MSADPLSPRLETLVHDTRALLERAVHEYKDVVYSNSLGAEAMVLTDIIFTHVPEVEMFTLDTGRLHDETLALLDRIERRYQRRIQLFYPDASAIEKYVRDNGINGFYRSSARLRGARRGSPVCAASNRRNARWARRFRGMSAMVCGRSARCSNGRNRMSGHTSRRAIFPTTRCTTRAFRASVAHLARVRSSPVRIRARADGGGRIRIRANADCSRVVASFL
jgi:3'-phosphoadenosine 5'-phosphosulfate sulfotransferase (PAPS reductase)/FAD synthetase